MSSDHKFPWANKQFGQHFLHSKSVIEAIVSRCPADVDAILEIGPGPAVLTPHLTRHGKPVFLVEMDERFVDKLTAVVPRENIFFQDALLFDGPAFFKQHDFKKVWLVSNLPYNVSVPLTTRFLEWPEISEMSLMYQKEVADKILPRDKNEMNSLHCLCASFFELSNVCFVPPGAFIPPPKVDSQVLHFKRKEDQKLLGEIKKLEGFLRVVFGQRRKQLGGILKKTYGEQITQKVLEAGGIDVTVRAETLSYPQVMSMYEAYSHSS